MGVTPETITAQARSPAHRVHLQVIDFGFSLETDIEEAARTVEEILAPFLTDPAEGQTTLRIVDDHQPWSRYALYLEDKPLKEDTELGDVLDYLFWYVNREAIVTTQRYLMVHAAAASQGGKGVLLPATMESGKSTLVAGLMRCGFEYLTDEAALIDPSTALLHPYPKALWLEQSSVDAVGGMSNAQRRRIGEQYHVLPGDLSTGQIGSAVPVRYVISPRYERAAKTRLVPVSRAEAIVMLRRNSFNFHDFGREGLDLLKQVAGGADCFELTVGRLSEAVNTITRLVTGAATPRPC